MTTTVKGYKIWNVVLWIAQLALAAMFTMTGYMKVSTPIEKLSAMMPWAADAPALVRFIGTCELLGAAGLILPALLRVAPRLTPWAAVGIATIMLLATGFHIYRGELPHITTTIGLGLVAVLVAWGRFSKSPIMPRGMHSNNKMLPASQLHPR